MTKSNKRLEAKRLSVIEIIKELLYNEVTIDAFMEGAFMNPLPDVGEWKIVYNEGADGAERLSVQQIIHFVDQNVYLRATGYYTSYEGYTFDQNIKTLEEVYPEEKIMIVYTIKK